jgi:hypothetical protein
VFNPFEAGPRRTQKQMSPLEVRGERRRGSEMVGCRDSASFPF